MPFTEIPLRLSRSVMMKSEASFAILQCLRDSDGSLIATQLDGSRPMKTSGSVIGNVEPCKGPKTATRVGCMSKGYSTVSVFLLLQSLCGKMKTWGPTESVPRAEKFYLTTLTVAHVCLSETIDRPFIPVALISSYKHLLFHLRQNR
jgi:hypothetical protein